MPQKTEAGRSLNSRPTLKSELVPVHSGLCRAERRERQRQDRETETDGEREKGERDFSVFYRNGKISG